MVEKVQGEVVGTGKTQNPQEQLPPVTTAIVKTKKPSALKKFWRGFFAEDLKSVKSNVVEEVVKPSIKTGIANAITSAVYMWLFGRNGHSTAPGGLFRPLWSGNSIINYNSMYRIQNGSVVSPNGSVSNGPKISVENPALGSYRSTDVYDPDYIHYGSWQDAENVYIGLCARISNYSVATVKNLYDLSSVSNPEVVLQNWGWNDIPWHRVVPCNDGTWVLKLPQPHYIKL